MDLFKFRYCYHGTTNDCAEAIINNIEINKGRHFTDFGQGFYLTSDYEQAKRRAKNKAEDSKNKAVSPAIIKVELNIDLLMGNISAGCVFEEADDEWASFVYKCRIYGKTEKKIFHDFDFVVGPVADGKMRRAIKLFDKGDMSEQEFRNHIKPTRSLVDQISIHTVPALNIIISKEVEQIEFSSI
ncbi:DUF3990 domain-containing protein [Halobacillus salinus]|uniref:DUF3990 domain-containing protein n=1 Tax=Halobacillus salinus TaxID=192814 RepID=UPI0015923631|nr:DUF3990 domain-containing protein [Halobacillus salinus]